MNDRLAFMDSETLGLDPSVHPVWELAVITGGEEYLWQVQVTALDVSLAQPEALAINGFEERYDPEVAVNRIELARELAPLLAGKVIVGANPHFDLSRIEPWFLVAGLDPTWHYRPICIESVLYGWLYGNGGRYDYPDVPWRASELYEQVTGLTADPTELHTALGDARYVRSLWEWAHS